MDKIAHNLVLNVHIQKLVEEKNALVVINHSGGKDSQAMYITLAALIPRDNLVVVHADLGEVEHLGVADHIRDTTNHTVHIAQAIWKDGTKKTLLDAIERRGMWPSSAMRYCTSDLKRTPCEKVIRRLAKERGHDVIISCFGFRAEESPARAKRQTWQQVKRNCTRTRTWFECSPIHALTETEVFDVIKNAGQKPHPVYEAGNKRLSCVFCVLASGFDANDLKVGARLRPDLYQQYVRLEKKMGHTFTAKASLEELVGVPVN